MLVRRDAAGVRLFTRNGHDWSGRFPLIAAAARALKIRSCLIDGEAVACDDKGMPSFDRIRYRRHDASVFLYAFDLIELNGDDLRREPLHTRKATLASVRGHSAGPNGVLGGSDGKFGPALAFFTSRRSTGLNS
jgi:ATP-dependent DNA ligase